MVASEGRGILSLSLLLLDDDLLGNGHVVEVAAMHAVVAVIMKGAIEGRVREDD